MVAMVSHRLLARESLYFLCSQFRVQSPTCKLKAPLSILITFPSIPSVSPLTTCENPFPALANPSISSVRGAEGTYVEVDTDGDGFEEDAKSGFERSNAGNHASRSVNYEYHLRLVL